MCRAENRLNVVTVREDQDQGKRVRRSFEEAGRPGSRHPAVVIWASVALASVGAVFMTASSDRGQERIAQLVETPPVQARAEYQSMADAEDIARLSAQLTQVRSEMRLLGLENTAMARRLATLNEAELTTASIPRDDDQAGGTSDGPTGSAGSAGSVSVLHTDLPAGVAGDAEAELDRSAVQAEITPLARASVSEWRGGVGYALRLGEPGDNRDLREMWDDLVEDHDRLLDDLKPAFEIVEPGETDPDDNARRLILRAGPIDDPAEAIRACMTIRAAGTACLPVTNQRTADLQ